MESLYKSLKFSKGYLYGFAVIAILPRNWFDQMAIAYYDILEPETTNASVPDDVSDNQKDEKSKS